MINSAPSGFDPLFFLYHTFSFVEYNIVSGALICLLIKTDGLSSLGGCPCGVMVKAMDCGIVVSKFVLQLRYYVHFRANTLGKGMNPLIFPAMGLIVLLLFFKENGFGIKKPTKVDMPLNIETKPNQTFLVFWCVVL